MANRLVSNVYIIDSQLGAVPLPWGDKYRVSAVGFYSINSNAQMQLAVNNTTNVIVQYGFFSAGSGQSIWQQFQTDHLGGIDIQQLYVPLLVSGTGFIYLV